eukprot:6159165-Pyramimonas_sp.AAC.1
MDEAGGGRRMRGQGRIEEKAWGGPWVGRGRGRTSNLDPRTTIGLRTSTVQLADTPPCGGGSGLPRSALFA